MLAGLGRPLKYSSVGIKMKVEHFFHLMWEDLLLMFLNHLIEAMVMLFTSPIYDPCLDKETHTPFFFFSFLDNINISLKTNRTLLMKQSNKGFHVRSKSPRGNTLLLFTHLLPVKPVSAQISLYGL